MAKKVCSREGCTTVLSIYNDTIYCALHSSFVKIDPTAKRTLHLRISGHSLLLAGKPHDSQGNPCTPETGTNNGYAKCQCGALSDCLPSDKQRQFWHVGHKEYIAETARLKGHNPLLFVETRPNNG